MIRKLIILLFVSTVAVSTNAIEFPMQKPKKIEVTFSSMMNAMHKNAYLVAGVYNAVLLGSALSSDLYDFYKTIIRQLAHPQLDMNDPRVKFFIGTISKKLIIMCTTHLIYASFWTLIEGAFIKYITKECDVNQE